MAYPDLNSKSAALYQRAQKVLPDGNSRTTIAIKPYPIYLDYASGAEVKDVDNNRYIDFNNNYTSLIHGHTFKPVQEAVESQLRKGTACSFTTETEIELAELLCERVDSFEQIRFCNSGSEAVMNMLKAARAFTGKPKVAKIEGLYHGSYDFAEVSLKNRPKDRNGSVPISTAYSFGTPNSVLDEVITLPFNEIEATEALINKHADNLACIMIDLMPATMGMVSPSSEYLQALVKLTKMHKILLAFDEVISFRLGYSGGQGMFGIKPDITSLGKIIGGGFPVGAVAGRKDVMSVFEPQHGQAARLPHGGTFNGNPVTMVAGKVAMNEMTEDRFEQLNKAACSLRDRVSEIFSELNIHGQVTGNGSLFALRFHKRPTQRFADLVSTDEEILFMDRFRRYLIGQGIWMGSGLTGCLSTATTAAHIDEFTLVLESGVKEFKKDLPNQ